MSGDVWCSLQPTYICIYTFAVSPSLPEIQGLSSPCTNHMLERVSFVTIALYHFGSVAPKNVLPYQGLMAYRTTRGPNISILAPH